MKRFINDIKRYYKYSIYAATAELKSEVAGSYLGWLWWFLEPLCFMFVYAFLVLAVFRTSEQYILAFVFVGNTTEVRRQIGNAVPPVGVQALANALKPLFTGNYTRVDLSQQLETLKNMSFEERYKLITK